MEPPGHNDLFDLKINPSAKIHIRRFAKIARISIVIGLLISFIHIASTVLRYSAFSESDYADYPYLLLENRLLPFYTIIYCLLFYPQLYLYWQVTQLLKKGLNYDDEQTFNKAFSALSRYALLGLILLMLSILSYGFELFVFIKYYLN
jgi:hypothetical protein